MFEKYKNTLLRGLSLYNYIQNNNPSVIIKVHKESVKLYCYHKCQQYGYKSGKFKNLRINKVLETRKWRHYKVCTSIRRYTIRRRVEEVINSANIDNFIMTNNEGAEGVILKTTKVIHCRF